MKKTVLFLAFVFITFFNSNKASAQDQLLGEIRMFAGNFAPRGWALCNGQTLAISENTALFSLIGTQFGGNGTSTFLLPDLRGRVPKHTGTGSGLQTVMIGQQGGSEIAYLTAQNLPPHNHPLNVSSTKGTSNIPIGNYLADTSVLDKEYSNTTNGSMNNNAIGVNNGGGQPFSIVQPYLGVNYIIALVGIFPQRN